VFFSSANSNATVLHLFRDAFMQNNSKRKSYFHITRELLEH